MDDSEIFLLDSEQSPDEDRSESPLEKLTSYLLNQNWFSKESDKSESSRSSDRLSEEDFVSDQVERFKFFYVFTNSKAYFRSEK